MTQAVLTPFEFSGTETLARRLFRKKLLPIGSINYEGRKIDFTESSLRTMVDSFNDGAFDNIPLQFAGDENKHTNAVERHRGDVVGMSLENDGLYVVVAATAKGAEALEENPKLGISARIINDYNRADGKHYQSAVQHVLATHDPRIPGLGPWSSVDSFSNNDAYDKLDLTAETFNVKPKKTKKEKSVPKKDNELTVDELARLRDFLTELDAADEAPAVDDSAKDDDDELTDAELATLLEALNSDEDAAADESGTTAVAPELADASLSNSNADQALELANSQAVELSRIRGELDDARWATERTVFAKEYGIPPRILDMAAPLLKGENHTIELSNGENHDAGATMRQVFTEIGKLIKMLDLSNELGSGVEGELDKSDEALAQRDSVTQSVRHMMGN